MFSWFKKSRTATAKPQTRRFRPTLEALEDRTVPALALTLTGDPNLIVMPIDTAGTYSVTTGQGLTWNNNNFTGSGLFTSGYAFERAGNIIRDNTPGSATYTVTDITTPSLLGVQVTGDAFGPALPGLRFERTFNFFPDSSQILGTIRLTNTTGGTTFKDVAYQDYSDSGSPANDLNTTAVASAFDANGNPHFVYSDVLQTFSPFNPLGLVMSMGSNDPRAVATAAEFASGVVGNPYENLNNPVLSVTNSNTGVALAFDFGDINPGETVVAQYTILFASTPQATIDAWLPQLPTGGSGLTNLSDDLQQAYRPLRYVFNGPASNPYDPNLPNATYVGNLTVTNLFIRPLGAIAQNNLTVVLPRLPQGVTVANPSGLTRSGNPYFTVTNDQIAPDGTVRAPISLNDPLNVHMSTYYFTYPLEVWAGAFDATIVL